MAHTAGTWEGGLGGDGGEMLISPFRKALHWGQSSSGFLGFPAPFLCWVLSSQSSAPSASGTHKTRLFPLLWLKPHLAVGVGRQLNPAVLVLGDLVLSHYDAVGRPYCFPALQGWAVWANLRMLLPLAPTAGGCCRPWKSNGAWEG